MRRRLFSRVVGATTFFVALLCVFASMSAAQAPAPGAPVLLLPVGARAIAMGEAGAALISGSGAVWWNPALIARSVRDVSFDLSSNASNASSEIATAMVIPIRGVGGLAFSAHYLNQGEEANTDANGDTTGTFVPTDFVVGATFAAPFGNRLAFGVTAKYLQERLPCTGGCDLPPTPNTGAVDVGMQYIATADSTFMFGATVRDLGFRLQINDAPQADLLPQRVEVGGAFAPHIASWPKELRVRGVADVVTQLTGDHTVGYRVGGELSWMESYHARVGYVQNAPNGGSGLTFGFGLTSGRLALDFAQVLMNVSVVSNGKPTYFTFRYAF